GWDVVHVLLEVLVDADELVVRVALRDLVIGALADGIARAVLGGVAGGEEVALGRLAVARRPAGASTGDDQERGERHGRAAEDPHRSRRPYCSAASARARVNTASSIGGGSLPVNVFCWLTW